MVLDSVPGGNSINDDIAKGHQGLDTIVGVVSFANHSHLEKSGVGCVLITDVQDWIKSTIEPKVPL